MFANRFLPICISFQPERINPDPSVQRQGYDIRSDVWSLGITMVSNTGLRSRM